MKLILFVLILLSLSISSFAARIPLAVYGLTPQQEVAPGLADMVSDMVRLKLRACGRFDLIEKAEMDKILKEHAFQQTGCTETECAVKMGKVLNVKKMIVGGLGKIGTAYRLSLRVVDVETALIDVEDAESQTVKQEELESKLVPPLVTRLCPKIKGVGQAPAPVPGGPEVLTGSLTVNSTPSGATVFLDGEPKGLTPQGLTDVPAGEHQIVLTLEGYKDYQEAVTVTKDAKKLVSAVLKMQIGGLRIFTTPSGASVSVDGVPRGVTTESGLLVSGLKVGEHQVRASKVRYEAYESSAFVEPDVVKDVKIDLSVKPGSVVIMSTPSGAEVYLDGVAKGVTPCSVSGLAPGTYRVKVRKEGYEEHTGSVAVQAGESEAFSTVLKKSVVPVTHSNNNEMVWGIGVSSNPEYGAEINWQDSTIVVKGVGWPPSDASPAIRRPMATREAKVKALSNMLEVVKKLPLSQSGTIENAMASQERVRTEITSVINASKVKRARYMSDGSVEVYLILSLVDIRNVLQ